VLPGYVLVQMEMTDDSWHVVKNTPGVTGFVGGVGHGAERQRPTALSELEVNRLLHTATTGDAAKPKSRAEFSLGEMVKVTSGALSDFEGEITEVNAEAGRLKVSVSIFERQVPVELAFEDVKKID
jgi:transcription termination/antitermination protein NusG